MPVDGSIGPVRERIEALDVLRGFALLGVFVMNMQGFAHSLFTPPEALASSTLDRVVLELRELLFAGKFNLLFGALFGIGFTLWRGFGVDGHGPTLSNMGRAASRAARS